MKKSASIILIFSTVLSFALSFPNNLHASVLMDLSTQELAQNSDSIITGRVVAEYSDWDPSGRFIITYITVKIDEDIKGNEAGANEVIVKKVGGRVGSKEMFVHGAPRFIVGERTLLFLGRYLGGGRHVVGMALGKFNITKDGSGEEFAENPIHPDIHFVKKDVNGKLVNVPKISQKKAKLADFVTEIKGYIKKAGE